MLLYNSYGRRKEEFIPVTPGHARVYVCGITAYDFCHIGHARSAVVFDALVRHLRNMGLETLFIRNFTDIDDKIIKRANEEKRDWREVATTYIQAFHEDMDRLNVLRPDLEPRATEYMSQIIAMCEKLIAKGYAYATPSGDVYFRVRAYEPYGKLSGRNLDEMRAGARVAPGEEKADALDFALWKGAKPGEPYWPSPWGNGRPGWHIECSAMNQPFLPLDIHGGGQDLVFPHHENEIAQSEAACDCELARYWVHNGFVRIDAEKMSKSLGNFRTIRNILEDWLPETLRFFLLGKHYRSPIDFTEQGMAEAERAHRRVYAALADAKMALKRAKWKNTPLPEEITVEWQGLPMQFKIAMDDDLNTAQALGHIFSHVRIVNRILDDKNLRASQETGRILEEFLERAHDWDAELGVFGEEPDNFLARLRAMRIHRAKVDLAQIETLLQARQKARETKNYAESDKLRDQLAALGVEVKDTANGQIWDMEQALTPLKQS